MRPEEAHAWLAEQDPDGVTGPDMHECDECGEWCNYDADEIKMVDGVWVCTECVEREEDWVRTLAHFKRQNRLAFIDGVTKGAIRAHLWALPIIGMFWVPFDIRLALVAFTLDFGVILMHNDMAGRDDAHRDA